MKEKLLKGWKILKDGWLLWLYVLMFLSEIVILILHVLKKTG